MLLKDLKITFEHGKILFSTDVVIRREERLYQVPVKIESNRGDLIETIDYALGHCENVDAYWKIHENGPLKTERYTVLTGKPYEEESEGEG